MKSSHGSQTRTCKKTRQMKQQQTLKINNQDNLNPQHYIYIYIYIYIYGVTNYCEMVKRLATTIKEQYYCKALSNETIKINVTISKSYPKLIRQLQQEKNSTSYICTRSEKKGPVG
jgi:isochorismate synthase EntC